MARQEMVKREQGDGKLQTLKGLLDQQISKFQEVAPKYMNVERLIRLMLAAYSRNPKIAQCSPASVLLFTMRCAETGLEPIGAGGAWPVPYENRKNGTTELQFIPDYRGLIALAKKNGDITDAVTYPVYTQDKFVIEYGMNPNVEHKPCVIGDKGELLGVYMIVTLRDGQKQVHWMDMADIRHIQGKSKASGFGPWKTDFVAMALKSVVRKGLKLFARSPQLQNALEYDNETFKDVVTERPPIEEAPAPKTIYVNPEPEPKKKAVKKSEPPPPPPPVEREPGDDDDEPPDFLKEEEKKDQPTEPEQSAEDIQRERKMVAAEIERLRDELGYDDDMMLNLQKVYGTELLAYMRRKADAKKNRKRE